MGFSGALRGFLGVVLLLFSCAPSEGQVLSSKKSLVLFPPGQPSKDSLAALCDNAAHRPVYDLNSLPSPGYSFLRRQATAVNSLETLYKGCCESRETQGDALTLKCAKKAWESALSEFCEQEFSVKTIAYHCCQNEDMLSCFEKWAPNPSYQHPPPQK